MTEMEMLERYNTAIAALEREVSNRKYNATRLQAHARSHSEATIDALVGVFEVEKCLNLTKAARAIAFPAGKGTGV